MKKIIYRTAALLIVFMTFVLFVYLIKDPTSCFNAGDNIVNALKSVGIMMGMCLFDSLLIIRAFFPFAWKDMFAIEKNPNIQIGK